jgi:DNA-binding transcriptional ArsR family regulator
MPNNKINSRPDKKIQEGRETLALLCKALGHPARLQIIQYLQQIDQCICGKIVDTLPLSQSTVSQHLKVLKEAGLIRGEVDGPRTCYCLNRGMLEKYKKLAAKL